MVDDFKVEIACYLEEFYHPGLKPSEDEITAFWALYQRHKTPEFDEWLKKKNFTEKQKIKILKEDVTTALLMKNVSKARDLIVTHIMSTKYIKTEREDENSIMYIYQDGIYVPNARTYIREFVEQICGAGFTKHLSNEIISRIEAQTYINAEELYAVKEPFMIAVQNGIINLKTKELLDFNPEMFFFF